MKQWTPAKEGGRLRVLTHPQALGAVPELSGPLCLVSITPARAAIHPVAPLYLSGTMPAHGSKIHLATTIDQHIAQKHGQGSTFPSMEFATEDHSSHIGSCAGDFLCSYMSTISWRTPTQPQPMELNPRVVFERMFGGDGPPRKIAWLDWNRTPAFSMRSPTA